MANITNGLGQTKVGVRVASGGGGAIDTDAQAFITAASITDTTQQSAINTLVTQLKSYGIWTKLKAVYPMVGGSASSHKFNLKDPRDLDAAYRLIFNGGWTHSSTGALPNGTTGYADTKLVPSNVLTQDNVHVSYYSRTNNLLGGPDFGTITSSFTNGLYGYIKDTDGKTYFRINRGGTTESSIVINDSRLFYMINRTSSNQEILFTNTTKNTFNYNSIGLSNFSIYLGSLNLGNTTYFGSKESAFASIGDGLTDTEAANFYTAVQTFQTTLGRQVGVPIVADTDAQAFLNAAVITDQTQASAVNTLVTDLKSANIWTKMKAIYPFVGGTATTHKFNLKDPRDLDVAYRLTFGGGWTHSSTGAQPNGTNGYANTFFIPNTQTQYNQHLSYYTTNNGMALSGRYKAWLGAYHTSWETGYTGLHEFYIGAGNTSVSSIQYSETNVNNYVKKSETSPIGFWTGTRLTSGLDLRLFKNGTKVDTITASPASQYQPDHNMYLGAMHVKYVSQDYADNFSNNNTAFASIGDGLTDAEAAAFYTAVQKYQTTLGRQV